MGSSESERLHHHLCEHLEEFLSKVMPVGNGEAGSFSYSSQKRRVVCGGKRHWILNPTKPPRLTWDSIIFVLVLYNSLLIPLTLSFSNFLENDVLTALSVSHERFRLQ